MRLAKPARNTAINPVLGHSPMVHVLAGPETAGASPLLDRRPVARTAPTARPDSKAGAFAIGVVNDRADFDALEPEWNDLFRRAGKPTQLFQSFNWNWHWANHFLPPAGASGGQTPSVVTVWRHGRLVMLWPLMMRRVAGLQVLHWMGEPASQYGDVLVEDLADRAELMQHAWQFVTTQLGADALHLRKVRADAVIAPLLRELGVRQTAAVEAPYLDLASAPDFESYAKRYTGKARKNRRRLARRLAEQGPCAVRRHVGGPEARAAAQEAIALKRAWVEKTGRLSMAFGDERFAAFFADVADGCGRPTGCGVTVLDANGKTAGVAIDITCQTHRAAHVIVHDPQLDHFSAGTLLLEAWIKGASADRMATFDLLAPAYAYKLDWADGSVAVGDYAQGLSLAGRVYAVAYLGCIRQVLKAAAEGLPRVVAVARSLVRAVGRQREKPVPAEPSA